MAELIRNEYVKLFEIRLFHHYWLDDGSTIFDAFSGERKERRLALYDIRDFLTIAPTSCTAKAIKGLRYINKETTLGCIMLVPENSRIPDDTVFEFAVTIRDNAFFDYTALTLKNQKIHEFFYKPEEKKYRYKENVPLLANKTGMLQGGMLFLSKEISDSAAGASVEALYKSDSALMQLTSDQPGAGTQQLNADAANMPVYCHQDDVPAIVPPAGLSDTPERGILLTDDIPDNVFLLLRLETMREEGGDLSIVDIKGKPKATSPVFQVRFKNRSTYWQYLNKATGAVGFTEADPLPLTYYDNAGTGQKPSEGPVKIEKSGDRVSRLVSQIFV